MTKPKMDFSKLEEYSRATQKAATPTAPPIQVSSLNAADLVCRRIGKDSNGLFFPRLSLSQLVVGSFVANVIVMTSVLAFYFGQNLARWRQPLKQFKHNLILNLSLQNRAGSKLSPFVTQSQQTATSMTLFFIVSNAIGPLADGEG